MKRLGNISNEQLKKEIFSGKRSSPLDAMTEIETQELVNIIRDEGGIAIMNGTILQTNREDLHNKYVSEYVLRKITL